MSGIFALVISEKTYSDIKEKIQKEKVWLHNSDGRSISISLVKDNLVEDITGRPVVIVPDVVFTKSTSKNFRSAKL